MSYWDQQAKVGGLRAVIDHNDTAGHKNAWIDALTKTALLSHGRFSRTDDAVDFGCGIGRITIWLGPRVKSVVGVDMSAQMVEAARASAREAGAANVSFANYDGISLGLGRTVDKVTCVYVLECIADDAAFSSALRELSKAARPGATLLFIERTSDSAPDEPWVPAGTIRRRPVPEYLAAFRTAGLRCVAQAPVRDPAPILGSRAINRLVLSGAFPRWALGWLAGVDLSRKARRQASYEWVDYLFVCEKV